MSSKSDEVLETVSNESIGSRLQTAREALGLSQKSLADDLYLPRNYIIWIEEGAYDKLPSMVFCRGYIRAYAKVVNENGSELIAQLDSIYGIQNTKLPLKSVSKINEQVKVGDPVMKWPTLLFILILCGVIFWWWKTQYGLSAPFLASQEPIAVETANGNELVLPSLDDNTVSGEINNLQPIAESAPSLENTTQVADVVSQTAAVDANVNVADESVELNVVDNNQANVINNGIGIELALNLNTEESQSENTEQLAELEKVVKNLDPIPESELAVATNTPPADDGVKLLQLRFSNECWVTIKDMRGKILFNGIKKSGQQISLSGDAPLRVSIGRVNSVSEITYGGVNVDLSALSRNNIANFKLPL